MYLTKQRPMTAIRMRKRGLGDDIDDLMAVLLSGDVGDASSADPTDNVMQTTTGTSTTASDFAVVAGVCKPQNFPALDATREMQRQLNRVAQVKGFAKTAVDGAVGPGTLALFTKVQGVSGGQVMGTPSSCMGVAPDVDVLGAQIKLLADSLGAPATVDGPVTLAPATIVTKSGKTLVAPDAGLLGAVASLSGVEKLALLGALGGIGYLLLSGDKKKRAK